MPTASLRAAPRDRWTQPGPAKLRLPQDHRHMEFRSPRDVVVIMAAEPRLSLAALSRLLGRNDAYLQQFVARGSPRRLDEDDRRHLAIFFGINERLVGARDPWTPCC